MRRMRGAARVRSREHGGVGTELVEEAGVGRAGGRSTVYASVSAISSARGSLENRAWTSVDAVCAI